MTFELRERAKQALAASGQRSSSEFSSSSTTTNRSSSSSSPAHKDDGERRRKRDSSESSPPSNSTSSEPPSRKWKRMSPILERNNFDILCGRGIPIQTYTGNIRLHEIVNSRRPEYTAASRQDKPQIIKDIVQEMKAGGGRFLRRAKVGGTDAWEEMDDDFAYQKVGHALRNRKYQSQDLAMKQSSGPDPGSEVPDVARMPEVNYAPESPQQQQRNTLHQQVQELLSAASGAASIPSQENSAGSAQAQAAAASPLLANHIANLPAFSQVNIALPQYLLSSISPAFTQQGMGNILNHHHHHHHRHRHQQQQQQQNHPQLPTNTASQYSGTQTQELLSALLHQTLISQLTSAGGGGKTQASVPQQQQQQQGSLLTVNSLFSNKQSEGNTTCGEPSLQLQLAQAIAGGLVPLLLGASSATVPLSSSSSARTSSNEMGAAARQAPGRHTNMISSTDQQQQQQHLQQVLQQALLNRQSQQHQLAPDTNVGGLPANQEWLFQHLNQLVQNGATSSSHGQTQSSSSDPSASPS